MQLSVIPLGSTEFELDEQLVYDFEVFANDDPVAAVSIFGDDPTFAHCVFADGHTIILDGIESITPEAILNRLMDKLQ